VELAGARVLVVEDDAVQRDRLVSALVERGLDVRSVPDGAAGLAAVRQWAPDAVVLDWELPILDGGTLTRAIKADPATSHILLIIASARGRPEMRSEGIEIGADDYLVKPIDPRELFARLRNGLLLRRLSSELEEKNRLLARLASTDPLTELPNRRAFDAALVRELRGAERHRDDLALVILDLDEFKSVNDRFGHDVGDEMLREVGARLREACRAGDQVARIGGEEFALILTRTSLEGAAAAAERTRILLYERPYATSVGTLRATASLGVASAGGEIGYDPREIYRSADDAMYRSKREGRNRVSISRSRVPRDRSLRSTGDVPTTR
jgi:two-component system cell cycle response regulator